MSCFGSGGTYARWRNRTFLDDAVPAENAICAGAGQKWTCGVSR
jgi:hypothetical protein